MRRPRFLALLILIALILFFSHAIWLRSAGEYLVQAGPPVQAEAVVVLAGDISGNRVLKAGDLVRSGFAPLAIVNGPEGMYGYPECALAIPFAVKHGYPEKDFFCFPMDAHSTREEAVIVVNELRRRGIHNVDVVTSDFHTRRAGKVLRALAGDIQIHMVASKDDHFSPGAWWHDREGRKIGLMEWTKTVAYWFGI